MRFCKERKQTFRFFFHGHHNDVRGNALYRYFDIARGSALESAGALDIIITKEYYPKEQINLGKNMLRSIVSMLVELIKRTSKDHVFLKD
ncbi:hypothetical protein [Candidatus Uabimicrobium sp. HlEnr_7]|uniref:hypothetical protein n=1 Tax=Candidatus Uabimicrobium helgolandensis TaxID=3095367 RepID=UPI003557B86E